MLQIFTKLLYKLFLMKNWLLIGGAIALYWFLSRGKALQASRFQLKNVGYKAKKLYATISVQNPTEATAELLSITGDLYANGKYVANISKFDKVTIAPNAETPIQLTFAPSLVGIFQTLKDFITGGKKGMKFRFEGSANVNGLNIPIDTIYTV